jgi:Tol biopolymer transport system component
MPEDTFEDIRRRLFDAAWELPPFAPEAPRTVARARRRTAATLAAAAIAAFATIAVVTATFPIVRSERTGRTTGQIEDHEFLVDLETGRRTELKGFPASATDLARSPDGDRLAFVSDVDGRTQIWVSELDGSNARPVTEDPLEAREPSWSPDGRRIVYVGFGHGSRRGLYVVNVRTGSSHLLYRGPQDPGIPSWSPDRSRILYRVAIPAAEVAPTGVQGRTIANGVSGRVLVVDVATKRVRVVAGSSENAAFEAAWLTDGTIVYIRGAHVGVDGPTGFALWTAEVDGSSRRPLVDVPSDHFVWGVRPSPDGSQIAYASILGSRQRLFVYDRTTATTRSIGPGWSAAWIDDHTLLVQRTIVD